MTFQTTIQTQFNPDTTKFAVLVSNEFAGLTRNGGIGTYVTTLSHQLAADGWTVVLLLTQTKETYRGVSPWQQIAYVFSTSEVEQVLDLSPHQKKLLVAAQVSPLSRSFENESRRILCFVEALNTICPDAIIYVEFPEIWGFGYHTIAAKGSGLLSPNVLTSVMTHGSFEWLAETNQQHHISTLNQAQWQWRAREYEQWCCDHADISFSPSIFLIEKMAQYGWQTTHIKHLPYFLPLIEPSLGSETTVEVVAGLRPVVFFGRLEERKGLRIFVAAVQECSEAVRATIQILFFGKVGAVLSGSDSDFNGQQYIDRELSDVVRYCLYPDLFSQDAITAIAQLQNPIVCLTSRAENFPYAALEMGQLPVHLVVADTGGFRETLALIERTEGVHWFAPDSIAALKDTLTATILNLEPPTAPDRDRLVEINQTLLNQRLELMTEAFINAAPSPPYYPQVAVFVIGGEMDQDIEKTLTQLAAQTYAPLEVWVAGGAIAPLQAQFSQYHWITLPPYQTLGETYNQLVTKTTADYVLCLSSGMIAQPDCIETLVKATGAGEAAMVVSPLVVADHDDQIQRILTVEGSLLQLLQQDYLYDIPVLCRKSWLTQYPYDETRGLAALNWSSLAAAIAIQQAITYYPYPLLAIAPDAPTIPPTQWPKERFHLRQFLFRIPPEQWSQRQLNLVLTGFEQLCQLQAPPQLDVVNNPPPISSSPQEQAWKLTAEQLHQELTQLQSLQTDFSSEGKQWLEAQWQTWLLKAQREETQGELLKSLTERMYHSKFLRLRRGLRKLQSIFSRPRPDSLQLPSHLYTEGVQTFITRLASQPLRYVAPEPRQPPVVSIISQAPTDICLVETTYRIVVNQTLQEFEWLLILNKYIEPSIAALLKSLSERSNKIRVLPASLDQGCASWYDAAIAQAQGQYVCFLDFGAVLDPTYLEKAAFVLATQPHIPVVGSYSIVFQSQEHWWQTPLDSPHRVLNQVGLMNHPVYRRICLEQANSLETNTELLMDWNYCLNILAQFGSGYTIPEYLDGFRATPETAPALTTVVPPVVQRQLQKLRAYYASIFRPRGAIAPAATVDLTTLKQSLPFPATPILPPSGQNLLLLCEDLGENTIASWNCDFILLAAEAGYHITLVTTGNGEHRLGECCYDACPDQFHFANLGDRVHWLAMLRYLITSRQINYCLLSGSHFGGALLPVLRAEWPHINTIAYDHQAINITSSTIQTWNQLTPYIDHYCFATLEQDQAYQEQAINKAISQVCDYQIDVVKVIQNLKPKSIDQGNPIPDPSLPERLLQLMRVITSEPNVASVQQTPSLTIATEISTKKLFKLLLKRILRRFTA